MAMKSGGERNGLLPAAMVAPVLFAAALMIIVPLADFAANVWPPQPGSVQWRYGAAGLLSSFVLTPLLGAAVASLAATLAQRRRTLLTLGVLEIAGAVGLVFVLIAFSLDVTQLNARVQEEARTAYWIGATKAAAKDVLVAAGLLWLGVASLRGARQRREVARPATARAAIKPREIAPGAKQATAAM